MYQELDEIPAVENRQLFKKGLTATLVCVGAYSMYPSGFSFGERITHGSHAGGYSFGAATLVAQASLTINAWHNIIFKGSHRSLACNLGLLLGGALTMVPVWISGYTAAEKKHPDEFIFNLLSTLIPCALTAGIYTDVVGGFIDNVRARLRGEVTLGERPVTKLQAGLAVGISYMATSGSFLISYFFLNQYLADKVPRQLDHPLAVVIATPSVICRGMLSSRALIRISSRALDYLDQEPEERGCDLNWLSILACLIGAAGAGAFTEVVLEGCERGGFAFGVEVFWAVVAFAVTSLLNSDATTRLFKNAQESLQGAQCLFFSANPVIPAEESALNIAPLLADK